MIILIYGLIILCCSIGILIKPKNKSLQYVTLGLIAFLMGRGAITLDTFNYYSMYSRAGLTSFGSVYEPGFLLLMKIGQWLGLSYTQFRITIVIMALFLINKVANKISGRNVFYFYLFYCIFLIFIDTVQIRNFIAFSFVIYGLSYILLHKRNSAFIYGFFVLLASTIHISSLPYFALLLLRLKNKRILINIISLFILTLCVLIYTSGNRLDFIGKIMFLISDGDDRLSNYLSAKVNLGFLYAFALQFLSILFLFIIRSNLSKECRLLSQYDMGFEKIVNFKKIIDVVLLISVISIVYFPLYMFSLQFIRIERNLLMLIFMTVALIFSKYKFINYQRIFFLSVIFFLNASWFYYTFIVSDHVEDIILPFFDTNTISTLY